MARRLSACLLVLSLSAPPAHASFIVFESVPLVSLASFAAVADLDRDGRDDLIVVSRADAELRVFLSATDSASHLEARTTVTFGSALRQPASGDLNGDGDADVAVPDEEAGGVWILLGRGDGTFLSPYLVRAGRAPFAVAVADFDGKQNDDLAIVDAKQDRVFIRVNDGQTPPQFVQGPDLEVGDKPVAVLATDVNRDDEADVVALHGGATSTVGVLVFDRIVAGFPFFEPLQTFVVGENAKSLLSADLNNDGTADLVTLNPPPDGGNASIDVLLGRGDGTFPAPRSLEVICPFFTGGVPCRSFAMAAGRFAGGDGNIDVAVVFDDPRSFSSSDSLQVLAGRGDGGFAVSNVFAINELPTAVAAGDFSGDESDDLAVVARRVPSVQVFINVATPGATPTGAECVLGDECLSGRCTNGRCCVTACLSFERCDVPGREGICTPVVEPLGCTDDLDCPGICRENPGRVCSDGGDCGLGESCLSRACRDEVCCDATCTPNVERCDAPGFEGVCIQKSETGDSCGTDEDCASGFCRDGVCCDSDCAAGVCDSFGQEGLCRSSLPLGAACDDGFGMADNGVCGSGICDCFDLICCDAVCAADEFCAASGSCQPLSTVSRCGDGSVDAGETCDDGGLCLADGGRPCVDDESCPDEQECVGGFCVLRCNASDDCPSARCQPVGGDGCAANCTPEDVRSAQLNTPRSPWRIQTTSTRIDVSLAGVQRFRTGRPRSERVVDVQGDTITEPGEIPVTITASDAVFEPLAIPGLVCACIRPTAQRNLFGPNIAGTGKIGCGAQGLTSIDYRVVRDHNTDPGDANNGTTSGQELRQLPDDPECDDTFVFPNGIVSAACREYSDDPACDDGTAVIHPGICNSPSGIERRGGQAPPGSALIHTSTTINFLADNGQCRTDRPMEKGECRILDYGPDCLPCTEDDFQRGMAESLSLTTGTAQAAVYDAGNYVVPPNEFPIPIDDGTGNACDTDVQCGPGQSCRRTCEKSGVPCEDATDCPNDSCRSRRCEFLCGGLVRCLTAQVGTAFDCDTLLDDPTYGLSEGVLAMSLSDVDTVRIGDNVTAALLAFERGPCPGDCDRSGGVRTDDLVTGVGIALGQRLVSACPLLDLDSNLVVSIDELVEAVKNAMLGCSG